MNRIKNCVKIILLLIRGLFIFLENSAIVIETTFYGISSILNTFNRWFEPVVDNWLKDLSEKIKDEDEDKDEKVLSMAEAIQKARANKVDTEEGTENIENKREKVAEAFKQIAIREAKERVEEKCTNWLETTPLIEICIWDGDSEQYEALRAQGYENKGWGLTSKDLEFLLYCYPQLDVNAPYTYDVHRHLFKMCKAKFRRVDGSIYDEKANQAVLFLEIGVYTNYCKYEHSKNISALNKDFDMDAITDYIDNEEYNNVE